MTVRIDDPDDPRIAAYRQVRERDLVGREGRFIAEGEVVLRVLLGSRLCRTVSILIDEQRLDRLSDLLSAKPDEAPLYVAAQPVIDAIAGFHLHRGILALGEPRRRPSVTDLLAGLPERALVTGLFGIGNHDNMGGIFRNAAAFGADAVVLNSDCCDPSYRKAIRVSVGASLVTPFAWASEGEDVIGALQAAGFDILALSPAGQVSLAEVKRAPRTAILLGAEGPGL
ncbi:MAG: RNA methyltransferase, partial [Alphaproteobacteria bacterium]